MKRGFTLIELIFVIVVLGILAAVAVPKFASVQDEANIASEKGGIAAIRSGVTMLHGKMVLTTGDVNLSVTKGDGSSVTVKVERTTANYPKFLSKSDLNTNGSVDNSDANMTEGTLCAVVDQPDQRKQWSTYGADADGHATKIKGPASRQITDTTAEISSSKHWEYKGLTGAVVMVND